MPSSLGSPLHPKQPRTLALVRCYPPPSLDGRPGPVEPGGGGRKRNDGGSHDDEGAERGPPEARDISGSPALGPAALVGWSKPRVGETTHPQYPHPVLCLRCALRQLFPAPRVPCRRPSFIFYTEVLRTISPPGPYMSLPQPWPRPACGRRGPSGTSATRLGLDVPPNPCVNLF